MIFRKKIVLVCSVHFHFIFIYGDKIPADHFKDEITPSIKSNFRIKFSQDVEMNHVR